MPILLISFHASNRLSVATLVANLMSHNLKAYYTAIPNPTQKGMWIVTNEFDPRSVENP